MFSSVYLQSELQLMSKDDEMNEWTHWDPFNGLKRLGVKRIDSL